MCQVNKLKVQKPIKICTVNNIASVCMFDLGSDCSIIRFSEAQALGLELIQTRETLSAFNFALTTPIARTKVHLQINGISFEVELFVVPDEQLSRKLLIGRDILATPKVKAIVGANGLKFQTENDSAMPIEVNLIENNRRDIIVEDVQCPGINDPKIIGELVSLLNRYRAAIALNMRELGMVNTTKLKIRLIDDEPVSYRPRRLSYEERKAVKKIVEELEETGIIRESQSPYASPILLKRRKNGEPRLCVDYRLLNRKIKADMHPLPHIEDQIDRLSGKKFFTSLDLKSGFHQIPIDENSIELTAFVTPDGHYEFLRTPFGLKNSPAVFQRAINRALSKLRFSFALVYIDDILVTASSLDEAFKNLETVLEALKNSNFTLNITKCKFFQTTIDYLGREILENGVRPGTQKINAVIKAPDPTDIKELRSFLGLVNYFRKFIKGFAKIVAPLS